MGRAASRVLLAAGPPSRVRCWLGEATAADAGFAVVSVPVELDALVEQVAAMPPDGFVLTTGVEGHVHVVSAAPRVDGDGIHVTAGRATRAHLAANPAVTVLWPRTHDGQYALIVDGTARGDLDGDEVLIAPSSAILHRLPGADADVPRCAPVEGATSPG